MQNHTLEVWEREHLQYWLLGHCTPYMDAENGQFPKTETWWKIKPEPDPKSNTQNDNGAGEDKHTHTQYDQWPKGVLSNLTNLAETSIEIKMPIKYQTTIHSEISSWEPRQMNRVAQKSKRGMHEKQMSTTEVYGLVLRRIYMKWRNRSTMLHDVQCGTKGFPLRYTLTMLV